MVAAASGALLALFLAIGAPAWGRTAEKPLWPQNGKQTSVEKGPRDGWEPLIVLDGRPVDRFIVSAGKPTGSHRFAKAGKDGRAHPAEDVDPEWVNLDGFAVLGGAPVSNSSAGPVRTSQTRARSSSSVQRATREDRRARSSGVSSTRTHRRAPQSSSGPRQPERPQGGAPLLERRHQHHTKPQSDQRNRHAAKLTSESVHVVSLQAQKAQDQRVPANRAVRVKTTIPEPPEYEARDISVRVLSPKSVLISWVDPAVEMGKVAPGTSRSYTVRYREKGESARWEFKEGAQRRMMIDTLSADGMYEFSVRISQGENQGKWSVSVFQRTPESAPSGPPENFDVKPLRGKGTAVIATWDPPEEPNGRIREYILSYAPATKPFGMKSVTYSSRTTTATIDGLTPGDRYIFKIRATNRKGQGPQSKAFSVAMPGSSSTAAFSKSKDNRKTGHTPTKQDTDHDESTTEPEEPPTPPQPVPAAPINRSMRPLSETRSFHSVFNSVRDIGKTYSSRAKEREDREKKERRKIPTTPAPVEETTTMKAETDNDGSPELEDVEYEEEPLTTEAPILKAVTSSPTKPTLNDLNPPPKRPVKIRVHQKPISKASSSSSSSSSLPSFSSSSSSNIQDLAASRKDYVVSTFPQSKNTDNNTSTQNKPSTPVAKDTEATDRASVLAGRSSGSKFINSRRHQGILFRGNSTRFLNGYKFAFNPRSNLPSRTSDQTSMNTRSSASSQSAQNHRSTLEKASTSQSTSDAVSVENSQSTSESQSHASTTSRMSKLSPSVSRTGSQQSLSTDLSASHRPSQGSASAHNTHTSYTTPEQDINEGIKSKPTAEEPTSNSKRQTAEEKTREDEKITSTNEKPVVSHTKISPSFAERFPWLASRYPGRFSPVPRTSSSGQDSRTTWSRSSSSAGADGPVLRETPTRVSGAMGAAGVSSIQETSEDVRTVSSHDSVKNGAGVSSSKPHLTNQHTASSHNRSPTTSSASSTSSSRSTLGSHQSSSGHRGSSGSVHVATSNNYNNAPKKDDVDERSTEISGKNNKDSRVTQNNPVGTGSDPRNAEDNENVDENETSPRSRSGTSSVVSPSYRQPGLGTNGRIRSPALAKRHFGSSRFSIRPKPVQNSRLDSSTSDSASSSPQSAPVSSERDAMSGTSVARTGAVLGSNSRSTSAFSTRDRSLGARSQNPFIRGKPTSGRALKPGNANDKNGRPNLTTTDVKESSTSHGTRKFITGPDGSQWVVDLEKGVLMNQHGKVLQDSQGKPKRVVLGEDGHTIFDLMGSPLVNQEGMALFGHGRDSQPVVNPKDKVLMIGGKQVLGLNPPRVRTTTTTTTTTTMDPTTTPVATTTDWASEEYTTAMPYPSCPPGTFSRTDAYGYPLLDPEGILDCYPEEESSGMELDHMVTVAMVPDALALDEDELFEQTTLLAPTTTTTTTTTTSTTTETPTPPRPHIPFSKVPSSELDLSGKKRFTAPYVNYIQKDPGAPCSLTDALEYLQVDILEGLMNNDSATANQKQPPKDKPKNLTVIAMEGCHSFIILDWARPLQNQMVSGYMVHSASYDDVLNNRWSSRSSSGTHLAVENLKPNSRYYFKVQAKNVFGLGPVSDTLTYVTESDDPLLIERPPGGEPIWIPFTFKYNPGHSSCKGSQYVKRTWYRKFVGVVLCNSLRYKIFMGDGLREPFYSIGDTLGQGEDHCQFVDSYRDGRTGPAYHSNSLPSAQGFYRAYRQEPVAFGVIGRRTPHPFVGWYECGVPIPGKW